MAMLDFFDLHTWVLADNSVTGAGVLSDFDSRKMTDWNGEQGGPVASRNKYFILFRHRHFLEPACNFVAM
jgi:hypothetical protein